MNTTPAAVTSAITGIAPVTRVGERALEVGPLTRELADAAHERRAARWGP